VTYGVLVIPAFDEHGNLPPGVHWVTWKEVARRFGGNAHRRCLLAGLRKSILALQHAGCDKIYINGSFVTSKENPDDFDGCWDVDEVSLDLLDPVLKDFTKRQAAQKKKFGGELFPNLPAVKGEVEFLELFQTDKKTGKRKGIIAIDLRTFE
jgi:hypothetical protein